MLVKKYDYDYTVERLVQIIRDRGTWKDMYESSTGKMLIELVAYAVDNLGYYMERRVQELYLSTCRLESSTYHLASLLGYLPIRKYCAIGTIDIVLKNARAVDVVIEKGFSFTIKKLPYVIMESGTITSGTTKVSLKAMQGELRIEEFLLKTTKEVDYVDIDASYNSISENYLIVSIPPGSSFDGLLYNYNYSTIPRPTWRSERYYSIHYYFDKLRIDFGTDGFGRNPSEDIIVDDKPMEVEYVITDGELGNIKNEVSGVHFDDRIYDNGSPKDEVKIEQYEIIVPFMSGAIDQETIDNVKLYAPRLYSTGKRAVTREDYRYWLERHPIITRANAWGEQEFIESGGNSKESPADIRNSACYTAVKLGEEEEYTIIEVSLHSRHFVINGVDLPIYPGDNFVVGGSTGNDGEYIISCLEDSVEEDIAQNKTTLFVTKSILDSTADGFIKHSAKLQALSEPERDTIEEYIYDYMTLTVFLKYYKPIIYYIDLDIYVSTDGYYTLSAIGEEIKTSLLTKFPAGYYTFEQSIFKYEFLKVVTEHAGVAGSYLNWFIKCEEIEDDYYRIIGPFPSPSAVACSRADYFNRYIGIFALRNVNIYPEGYEKPVYIIT